MNSGVFFARSLFEVAGNVSGARRISVSLIGKTVEFNRNGSAADIEELYFSNPSSNGQDLRR